MSDRERAVLVSIVVPVYNVGQYLEECLESVKNQTECLWECVCVDDGSVDASTNILDEKVRQNAQFHVVHQRNAGVSMARNRALECVQGEWVGFLDGDDKLSSDWVAHLRDSVAREPLAEMICFGVKDGFCCLKGKEKSFFALSRMRDAVWLFAYKQDTIGDVRFKKGLRVGEDWLFGLDVALRAKIILLDGYNGYSYRESAGSATRQNRRASDALLFLPEYAKCFLGHWDNFQREGLCPIAREQFSIAVRLTYVWWFGGDGGQGDYCCDEYCVLLRQLHDNSLFKVMKVGVPWVIPMALLYYFSWWHPLCLEWKALLLMIRVRKVIRRMMRSRLA